MTNNEQLRKISEMLNTIRQDLLKVERMVNKLQPDMNHNNILEQIEEELADELNDYHRLIKDEDDPGGVP